jgi:hypothetical protein
MALSRISRHDPTSLAFLVVAFACALVFALQPTRSIAADDSPLVLLISVTGPIDPINAQ